MPFTIVRDDITHVRADAIVNAANEHLWAGGGVCGAIFDAAGARKLQAACDKIGHCDTGSAVATPAFKLPARYVIHAVGPVWYGGDNGEPELLASCYRSSLELAAHLECQSIAFPLISAGIYGYPHREALAVAQEQIRSFLDTHEMDVTLVLYDPRAMELADDLRLRVERYIDDVYVDEHAGYRQRAEWEGQVYSNVLPRSSEDEELFATDVDALNEAMVSEEPDYYDEDATGSFGFPSSAEDGMAAPSFAPPAYSAAPPEYAAAPSAPAASRPTSAPAPAASSSHEKTPGKRRVSLPHPLRNLLDHMDAGFSETLLAMIDERGLKDAQVYRKANLSRQHFSKIRSNPRYKPTKTTVLALAVALELTLDETTLLLERAGFALSHADKRDVIVEFFIREHNYDVFQINDTLFAFDQPLLG